MNYKVVRVLGTYFSADAFNQDAIHKSAILVNVLGGLQIVVGACSWAYSRNFGFRKIIIFSTAINILVSSFFWCSEVVLERIYGYIGSRK